MARTKQTARKAQGGKAPRSQVCGPHSIDYSTVFASDVLLAAGREGKQEPQEECA